MRVANSGQGSRSPQIESLKRRLVSSASLTIIVAVVGIGSVHQAMAAPVDADTAKRIALEVLGLAPAPSTAASPNGMKSSYTGDIKVETNGDNQLVTVPKPLYVVGSKGETKIAFDQLAVSIGPSQDSNGHARYPVTYQKPPAPVITGPNGPGVSLTYGDFAMNGLYAPDLKSFLNVTAAVRDIMGKNPTSPEVVKIASITIDQNATEDNGTITGQNIGSAKGLDVTGPDGTVSLGEIRVTVNGNKMALAPWIDATQRIVALMPQSPAEKPDPALMNTQIKSGLDIAEKLPPLADKMSVQLGFSDLKVAMKDGTNFQIGSQGLGINYTRLGDNSGDAQVDVSMAGLKLAPETIAEMAPPNTPQAILDLIPTGAHMTMGVKGAPTRQIVAEIIKAARTYTDTTDQSTFDTGLQAVAAALSQAHSQLALGFDIASPALTTVANSALTVDSQSAFGVNGTGKVTVTGLDQEMTKLRGSNDPTAQQASAGLTLLKGMGTPRPAGNDIVYDYALVVSPDGKFTVNGQDVAALMGMGGPPGAPPAPDAVPAPAPAPAPTPAPAAPPRPSTVAPPPPVVVVPTPPAANNGANPWSTGK